MNHPARDVVIIGAARSGTNMLRDALTSLDGVATWPCDEINYVWRHGNTRFPTDELPPTLATEPVAGFIRGKFGKLRKRTGAPTIIEKTCANSLRVPFVDRILPDATFIYIVRDGIDAAVSAKARWTAPLDISYVAQKARFVPATDLPYYATKYLKARAHRLVSSEGRISTWGPRPLGLEDWLREFDLISVCALQWQACVDAADRALENLPRERTIRVRYEDLVSAPMSEFRRICDGLELPTTDVEISQATSGISASSVGRGRASLAAEKKAQVEALVKDTLSRHEY